jgi:ElaA protein
MINWQYKFFTELSPQELYAIIRLRNEVFVVEQNCVFQDADNKDQTSYHFMGWDNDVLAAYTRILPPGLAYEQASIGRVITAPTHRGTGIGKILMEKSIELTHQLYGIRDISIGAQVYLKKFYESLGFNQSSDIYLEDGIEHIEMIRRP